MPVSFIALLNSESRLSGARAGGRGAGGRGGAGLGSGSIAAVSALGFGFGFGFGGGGGAAASLVSGCAGGERRWERARSRRAPSLAGPAEGALEQFEKAGLLHARPPLSARRVGKVGQFEPGRLVEGLDPERRRLAGLGTGVGADHHVIG